MLTSRPLVACALAFATTSAVACGKSGDTDKGAAAKPETKLDPKAAPPADPEGEPTLAVAGGDPLVDGPVPPEASMVFFSVEGALYPLACFDHAQHKLLAGDACMGMVPAGSPVRVASKFSSFNKVAGERAVPQCLVGTDKKVAIAVEGITEGADFIFGTWPAAAVKMVRRVADDSTLPAKVVLSEGDKAKLSAAAKVGGDLQASQVAELDLDGDGKPEKIFAAFIPDPNLPESYKWSGAFVAPGGDLEALQLVDRSTGKPDLFEIRGALDLDGDKRAELWVRRISQDGSAGERLYVQAGADWKGLGQWTCGAV